MKTYPITITLDDLRAAQAIPWDTSTCIVAQAFMRCTGIRPDGGGASGFYVKRSGPSGRTEDTYSFDTNVADIIQAFDQAHQAGGTKDYSCVARLLPLTLNATLT